jgi:hypothetical protein
MLVELEKLSKKMNKITEESLVVDQQLAPRREIINQLLQKNALLHKVKFSPQKCTHSQ